MSTSAHPAETVHTLVIGAGQAGLATSYWLTQAGTDHLVIDRRDRPGGSWRDRWDTFHLVAPNRTILLPGKPYAGEDPDGFLRRDGVVNYLEDYAASIRAPLRLRTGVNRLTASDDGFEARTDTATFHARNVVLAAGPYQRPRIPAVAQQVPRHIQQLHSQDYRRPEQLADGGVLVVGTGQSGAQIAEELHAAGRQVHLAVSMCGRVPPRYRGRALVTWMLEIQKYGPKVGLDLPTVARLPSPAARFAPDPHVSGVNGGHEINLRTLARQGVRLYGHLESVAGTTAHFSDDLEKRLVFADTQFGERIKPLFDTYVSAAGIDAPPDDRPPHDGFTPTTNSTELHLGIEGVAAVIWATGYRLDFGWLDIPGVLDEWGYPRHSRGVTVHPGLYAVGLPWLHTKLSSLLAGVGADAAHVVDALVERRLG